MSADGFGSGCMGLQICNVKRRRVILILLAGVVAFIVWPGEREPEYQGKKLSGWLHGALTIAGDDYYPNDQEQDAVRHIGTNALPCLLKWMCYKRSKLGNRAAAIAAKLPWGLANTRFITWMRKDKSYYRIRAARTGLAILGREASPAIPELARMAAGSESQMAYAATVAIAVVGEQGFPPILAAIVNPIHPNRDLAMRLLVFMKGRGVDVTSAVPAVVGCLQETNAVVAGSAAETLGDLNLKPELSVPALGRHVQDPRQPVRVLAVFALAEFEEEARPAVPALIRCLSDADRGVREDATTVLRKIAPEILAKEQGTEKARSADER